MKKTHNRGYKFTQYVLPQIVLLAYTILALFPIVLIIQNSLKTRKAIFKAPLTPPVARYVQFGRLSNRI